jgi:hypothetical protein
VFSLHRLHSRQIYNTEKKVKEEYFKMCGSEQRGMEAYSSER